jgi:hypothetical protein
MGMIFLPFNSPWGANCNHPRPLMNEFPAGNRGTGPRCHLYTGQFGVHRTCPVNYSGAAAALSRGWRVPEAALPWSTGHYPVYTGQSGKL